MNMKCPKCGEEVAEGSNFCEYCGTRVSPKGGKGGKSKKAVTIVAVLLALAVVVTVIVLVVDNNNRPVYYEEAYDTVAILEEPAEIIEEPAEEIVEEAVEVSQDGNYIDLGLPSGTLWCDRGEPGYYSYDEAVSTFGNRLPSREQFEELRDYCTWKWVPQINGYGVTGPNGQSIFFMAYGFYNSYSEIMQMGNFGCYWSCSISKYLSEPVYLQFREGSYNTELRGSGNEDLKFSVRTVKP